MARSAKSFKMKQRKAAWIGFGLVVCTALSTCHGQVEQGVLRGVADEVTQVSVGSGKAEFQI